MWQEEKPSGKEVSSTLSDSSLEDLEDEFSERCFPGLLLERGGNGSEEIYSQLSTWDAERFFSEMFVTQADFKYII